MKLRRNPTRGRGLRTSFAALALGAMGVAGAFATPALASSSSASGGMTATRTPGSASLTSYHYDYDHGHDHEAPVRATVLTPSSYGSAGAGGTFNVDVELQATSQDANNDLSADAGYIPFINTSGPTFGPGLPDPGAPGLVVLLSTTPSAAGGPNANLAGVFQLNGVEQVDGLNTTFNDWTVGVPGFFGQNVNATLTVFVVDGTAPGQVNMQAVHPISNVVQVPFHIAG
jgi:hypothetical protein